MNKKLVSIIVPLYNCEKTVTKLITCLKAQTYSNFEVLLINDGSIDNTEEVCQQAIYSDPHFQLVTTANSGVSSARNLGLSLSNGNYITFIDADDFVNECYIEELVNKINTASLSIATMRIIRPDKKEFSICKTTANNFNTNAFLLNHWSVCGRMYRREDISNIRFDESVHIAEDLKFTIDYLCSTQINISHCEKSIYYYVQNNGSAMLSEYSSKFLTGVLIEYECIKKLTQNGFNVLDSQLLGNGLYQMLTRYFEQDYQKRQKHLQDYCIVKNIIKEHLKIIVHEQLDLKKKIFIIISCFFPSITLLYKHFKFLKVKALRQ